MGKPTICIDENKGADQLRSNCEADQRLCFHYTESTIPLLSKSKISSLYRSSVTEQPGLCRTWSEPKLLVFSSTGSNGISARMLPNPLLTCYCKPPGVLMDIEDDDLVLLAHLSRKAHSMFTCFIKPPGIYTDGYIVFAFPFVRSCVRMLVS